MSITVCKRSPNSLPALEAALSFRRGPGELAPDQRLATCAAGPKTGRWPRSGGGGGESSAVISYREAAPAPALLNASHAERQAGGGARDLPRGLPALAQPAPLSRRGPAGQASLRQAPGPRPRRQVLRGSAERDGDRAVPGQARGQSREALPEARTRSRPAPRERPGAAARRGDPRPPASPRRGALTSRHCGGGAGGPGRVAARARAAGLGKGPPQQQQQSAAQPHSQRGGAAAEAPPGWRVPVPGIAPRLQGRPVRSRRLRLRLLLLAAGEGTPGRRRRSSPCAPPRPAPPRTEHAGAGAAAPRRFPVASRSRARLPSRCSCAFSAARFSVAGQEPSALTAGPCGLGPLAALRLQGRGSPGAAGSAGCRSRFLLAVKYTLQPEPNVRAPRQRGLRRGDPADPTQTQLCPGASQSVSSRINPPPGASSGATTWDASRSRFQQQQQQQPPGGQAGWGPVPPRSPQSGPRPPHDLQVSERPSSSPRGCNIVKGPGPHTPAPVFLTAPQVGVSSTPYRLRAACSSIVLVTSKRPNAQAPDVRLTTDRSSGKDEEQRTGRDASDVHPSSDEIVPVRHTDPHGQQRQEAQLEIAGGSCAGDLKAESCAERRGRPEALSQLGTGQMERRQRRSHLQWQKRPGSRGGLPAAASRTSGKEGPRRPPLCLPRDGRASGCRTARAAGRPARSRREWPVRRASPGEEPRQSRRCADSAGSRPFPPGPGCAGHGRRAWSTAVCSRSARRLPGPARLASQRGPGGGRRSRGEPVAEGAAAAAAAAPSPARSPLAPRPEPRAPAPRDFLTPAGSAGRGRGAFLRAPSASSWHLLAPPSSRPRVPGPKTGSEWLRERCGGREGASERARAAGRPGLRAAGRAGGRSAGLGCGAARRERRLGRGDATPAPCARVGCASPACPRASPRQRGRPPCTSPEALCRARRTSAARRAGGRARGAVGAGSEQPRASSTRRGEGGSPWASLPNTCPASPHQLRPPDGQAAAPKPAGPPAPWLRMGPSPGASGAGFLALRSALGPEWTRRLPQRPCSGRRAPEPLAASLHPLRGARHSGCCPRPEGAPNALSCTKRFPHPGAVSCREQKWKCRPGPEFGTQESLAVGPFSSGREPKGRIAPRLHLWPPALASLVPPQSGGQMWCSVRAGAF
ncbi:collagen, type I, alpha 1a-like [Tiliqua scincoides]|uniref:collagen, type I, alpha 1a-like n=1 Tax=Tiliqua scincoides TaxID=71010 RepID=UPI003461A488